MIQKFNHEGLKRFFESGEKMNMYDPPHPGEIIREFCMKAFNINATEAAKALGVTRKTLSALLKGRTKLLKTIEDMVDAQYSLHAKDELSKNFDELPNNEAARGSNIPTGALAGKVSNLYVSEIGVFSGLLEDAISHMTPSIETKALQKHLSALINKMLSKKNSDIKTLYNRFKNGYYKNMGIEHINIMNNSFSNQADDETKQRIKYLLSINNLANFT